MALVKPGKLSYFDGRRDLLAVRAWLFEAREKVYEPMRLALAERHGGEDNIPEDSDLAAIRMAATYFAREALIWWMQIGARGPAPKTWNDFVKAVALEFSPTDGQRRARDQLAALEQTRSVIEYSNRFEALALQIDNLSSAEKMDRFVRGLKARVRVEVLKARCATVADAKEVALAVDEATWLGVRHAPNESRRGPAGHQQAHGRAPMEIGTAQVRAEQTRRTLRCYGCGQEGHMRRDCPTQGVDIRRNAQSKSSGPGQGK